MKKIVFLGLLITIFSLSAVENNNKKDSFGYFSMSSYIPVPLLAFGGGYFKHTGDHLAIDVGGNITTLIQVNDINIFAKYKYFPKDKFFIGLGGTTGAILTTKHFENKKMFYASPVLSLGYNFDRNFLELEGKYVKLDKNTRRDNLKGIPVVMLKYGINF